MEEEHRQQSLSAPQQEIARTNGQSNCSTTGPDPTFKRIQEVFQLTAWKEKNEEIVEDDTWLKETGS